ncbi:MAG TPA: FAD-dependent oxidoreductase [Gaiellaceae bacterium]
MTAFPNYLDRRQPLPLWAWRALAGASVLGALALVAVLFVDAHAGLIAWWLFVLPVLPLVWLLAPGLWRNVCPMAALNQYPRLLGFTRGKTVPPWLRRNAFAIQVVLYFALISTRAPVFDHNGAAVGVLMLVALGAAFAGGVAFKGKSGWCGTFCPLLPIQRLYGQTPAVPVPNAYCRPCVGCVKNCYDFNPDVAAAADLADEDPRYVAQRKIFAGTFPGFVIAFFTIPSSQIAAPADMGISLAGFYGQTVAYMLVSLGAFYLLDALALVTPVLLTAVFAAVALNAHNVLRFPTAFDWDKPGWLLVGENVAVAAVTVVFVYRTWVKEQLLGGTVFGAAQQLDARPAAGLEAARAASGETYEVTFLPQARRAVARRGATLLEVAEKAELPLEAGCRMGVCGADPLTVLAGDEQLSEVRSEERATLERLGLGPECRLACCARILGDVRVSLDVSAGARTAEPRAVDGYDRSIERVVVIGNGIAGVTAADHVRRAHPDCAIDLVGEELHPLYNRMAISRLVYGRTAMSGLLLLPDDWYERNAVTCWLNTQVRGIDVAGRVVVLGTGERLPYDRLILAMGSSASVPPLQGVGRAGVFVVRRADDAGGVRAYVQRHQCRRAVVVGGGPLGIEVAYALHRLGLRVRIVQRSDRLLRRELDPHGGELVRRYVEGLGIGVELGAEPTAVEGDEAASALALADARRLPLDLLVLCAGIRPNAELARAAGLAVGRGVLVDEQMRTSDAAIFAAGDVAEVAGEVRGLWPNAVAQAEVAAANAVGAPRRYEPAPPVAVVKGIGLAVTSVGAVDAAPGDEVLTVDGSEAELRYARLVVRDGRLAGAAFVGNWPEQAEVLTAVAEGRRLTVAPGDGIAHHLPRFV